MNVLFIGSGNSKRGISPAVQNQLNSLQPFFKKIDFHPIQGKGFISYFKNIKPLRKKIKNNHYDIVHAHYSLSGFVAALAGAKPLVVSLMGSDVKEKKISKFLIKFFHWFFWDITIVKSIDMKNKLGLTDIQVIPNGVNLEHFKPQDKSNAQKKLNWDPSYKHILFAADPKRYEKNFSFANNTILKLNRSYKIKLHTLVDIPYELIPFYYNGSDVVILTSLWEGSPNVIKEAMACNTPVVSTNVGDVKWLLNGVDGCFISDFDPESFYQHLKMALTFAHKNGKTNGREKLISLGLDETTISNQILNLYKEVLA